ncbi:hypothetical protein CL689_05985 [Candidatus Saccharibacteria bacterium]|nr:hypothetical protein [Candidatus Saccharibacteria bacterium]|tara:strand:+ start:2320 stop:2907 length:588 start_codon:yes stop_codon:yes gene_type:complete
MQLKEQIKRINSKWPEEHIEAFFDFLDTVLPAYGAACDFEVKRFWLAMLDDHPLERVIPAMRGALRKKIYGRPTPDVVISELEGGDITSRALLAWAEVLKAIRLVGPYQSVEFSSPAIAGAVRRIGWSKICSLPDYDLEKLQADFHVYLLASKDDHDPVVRGMESASKRLHGSPCKPPVRICGVSDYGHKRINNN